MSQLRDLVVLELASVLAGPGVGQFFAELGARVIKVENLKTSGDVTRTWKSRNEKTDEVSAYFSSVNWGKQSIAIDLTTAQGQRIVHQLAALSDIVIGSYKPGDAEKLGVDYRTLSKDHRELIYGQITGYGSNNQRVGYDAIIQAEAGFMYMNGEPGGRSLKMPVALMDILAGHQLKEGLLLAMLDKSATGKGKLVEVSLIQAAVASLANQATNYLVGGQLPGKQGSAHPNIAPYGDVFLTADEKEILLAVGTDKQFLQLSNILKINDVHDPLFKDNPSRVRNRDLLHTILSKAIRGFSSENLLAKLKEEKIPAGLVRDISEVVRDPDINEIMINHGRFRGIRNFVAQGLSISPHLLPPPHLGEHSREILEEMLKFSPSEVRSLFLERIVR